MTDDSFSKIKKNLLHQLAEPEAEFLKGGCFVFPYISLF